MATNLVKLNVYQINNRVMDRDVPTSILFPTQGAFVIYDCSTSPTRSLPSGYNVYSMILVSSSGAANSAGNEYYVGETNAQIVTMFNA